MRVLALMALLLAATPARGEETSLPICVREPETERDGVSFLDTWVATARVVVAREPCPVPGPDRYVGRFEKRGREVVFVLATPTSGRLEKTIPWLDRTDAPLSDLLKAGRLSEFSVWVEALLAEDRLLVGWRLPEGRTDKQPKPVATPGSSSEREGPASGSGGPSNRRGSNGNPGVALTPGSSRSGTSGSEPSGSGASGSATSRASGQEASPPNATGQPDPSNGDPSLDPTGVEDPIDPAFAPGPLDGKAQPAEPGDPKAARPDDTAAAASPSEAENPPLGRTDTTEPGTAPPDEGTDRQAGSSAAPTGHVQPTPRTSVVPDDGALADSDWDAPFTSRQADRDLLLRVAGGLRFRSPHIIHPEIALGMVLGPAYFRAGWQFPVTWSMGDFPVEAQGFSFEAGWTFSLWERGSWELDGRLGLAADRLELVPLYTSDQRHQGFWDGGAVAGSGLHWKTGVGIGVRLTGAVLWMPTAPLTRVGEVGPRATVNSVGGRLGLEISFPE